jgi:hypothetical protein
MRSESLSVRALSSSAKRKMSFGGNLIEVGALPGVFGRVFQIEATLGKYGERMVLLAFPRAFRRGAVRFPARRQIDQFRDGGIQLVNLLQGDEPTVTGFGDAIWEEEPHAILPVPVSEDDGFAFENITRNHGGDVWRIGERPIGAHGSGTCGEPRGLWSLYFGLQAPE